MPRERKRRDRSDRADQVERNRVSDEDDLMAAVNNPMHHLLLYEPERLVRGEVAPSVARTARDGRKAWSRVSEPGDMPESRGGIIR